MAKWDSSPRQRVGISATTYLGECDRPSFNLSITCVPLLTANCLYRKPREALNYMGGMQTYKEKLRESGIEHDFAGYELA